jgi:hypothetical protein
VASLFRRRQAPGFSLELSNGVFEELDSWTYRASELKNKTRECIESCPLQRSADLRILRFC